MNCHIRQSMHNLKIAQRLSVRKLYCIKESVQRTHFQKGKLPANSSVDNQHENRG